VSRCDLPTRETIPARYDYHRPRSLEEASRLGLSLQGARFIAGGTDLLVRIRAGNTRPEALVSLRGIEGLAGIEIGPQTRIGATTLIADIASHPGLRESFPVLCEAAGRLGSEQIRNAATIGGNLCNASPCADTAPALLVLDARVRLWSVDAVREVPLVEFFTGPGQTCMKAGELLHSILLQAPTTSARSIFFKKGRVAMDLATASVAGWMHMDADRCVQARFAAGSVAPLPLRLTRVEELLRGAQVTPERIAEARRLAEQDVKPITDLRSSADYRRQIVGVYVQRAIETLSRGTQR